MVVQVKKWLWYSEYLKQFRNGQSVPSRNFVRLKCSVSFTKHCVLFAKHSILLKLFSDQKCSCGVSTCNMFQGLCLCQPMNMCYMLQHNGKLLSRFVYKIFKINIMYWMISWIIFHVHNTERRKWKRCMAAGPRNCMHWIQRIMKISWKSWTQELPLVIMPKYVPVDFHQNKLLKGNIYAKQ